LVRSCTSLAEARAASAAKPNEYFILGEMWYGKNRCMRVGTCPTNLVLGEVS